MNDLLDSPWTAWLDAFETHLPGDIALVTLEPDLLAQQIDVEAQADTLDDLLVFERALARSPMVSGIEALVQDHPGDAASEGEGTPSDFLRKRWRVSLHEASGVGA